MDHKEIHGEKANSVFEVHLHIKLYSKALVSILRRKKRKHRILWFIYLLVGNGWEGDIALDDIKLTVGDCPISDVCTFESGLCDGWEKGPDGDFEWSRGRNGSTPSGTPTVGSYLFIYLFIYLKGTKTEYT